MSPSAHKKRNIPITEASHSRWVLPEIELGADEDHGRTWGVVLDLGEPLHMSRSAFTNMTPEVSASRARRHQQKCRHVKA
jgi:hypothetical protein